jgi:uncharacterized membrane protein YfcA
MADLWVFIVIGFCAQIVDGALGMAFGLISTSALLAFGVPPATASAMTHVAEMFTTAASGASHTYQRNIDWRFVARLAPAGMVGGAVGAYVLASIDAAAIEPFISGYLILMGIYVLYKAFRPLGPSEIADRSIPFVGLGGGTLDAMGGGGWGPIVTTTLVARGHDAKKVIGSTNLTEFLVTSIISLTFILTIGWSAMNAATGLIIGGVLGAPIGALVVKRMPIRALMIGVAMVIIATSAWRFAQ